MPTSKNTHEATPSPKRRRLSRSAAAGRTMSYDQRYHPMDDVTRPASAAALKAAYGIDTPCPSNDVIPPKRSKAKLPKAIPRNSLLKGWKSLEGYGRLLYSLQKGAPLHSATLPMTWPEVAQVLQGYAEESERDYTTICTQLQDFYGAVAEPTTRADQELHYAEGFDVYDVEVGDKYWKHRKDNIVLLPDLQDKEVTDTALHTYRYLGLPARSIGNSDSDDNGQGGLSGSYNDAESYIRQSFGWLDTDTQDFDAQESPETEILASLRRQISTSIDDILEPEELTAMFQSSADHGDEDTSTEAVPPCGFSVHEDQPGSTPKVKKQQLAMHPKKSPGIDHPKENWHERSPNNF
ncbi:MAG: hypothetical protein Q9209_000854 [Squamulea sp. 1 TL-2023]